MSYALKHCGRVIPGPKGLPYLSMDNSITWNNQLLQFQHQEVEIIIQKKHKRVSHSQHGFYRGGVLPFLTTTEMFGGWEADEIHERHFAEMFLGYTKVIVHNDGKIQEKKCVRSTASLTEQEMSAFISKVIAWCAVEGIEIPDSKDFYLQKYREVNQ